MVYIAGFGFPVPQLPTVGKGLPAPIVVGLKKRLKSQGRRNKDHNIDFFLFCPPPPPPMDTVFVTLGVNKQGLAKKADWWSRLNVGADKNCTHDWVGRMRMAHHGWRFVDDTPCVYPYVASIIPIPDVPESNELFVTRVQELIREQGHTVLVRLFHAVTEREVWAMLWEVSGTVPVTEEEEEEEEKGGGDDNPPEPITVVHCHEGGVFIYVRGYMRAYISPTREVVPAYPIDVGLVTWLRRAGRPGALLTNSPGPTQCTLPPGVYCKEPAETETFE